MTIYNKYDIIKEIKLSEMLILQIVSALLLLLNKIFVYLDKAIGWIFGALGAFVINFYFYFQMTREHKQNLSLMFVLDIALIILMMYGYLVARSETGEKLKEFLKKWNILFKTIVTIITISVCTLFLIETVASKLMIVQFVFAIGSLFGTLFRAFNKKIPNIIGWVLYLVAHMTCIYIMLKTDSPYMAIAQGVSSIVAVLGIRDELKK